jgi:hypothetical protein
MVNAYYGRAITIGILPLVAGGDPAIHPSLQVQILNLIANILSIATTSRQYQLENIILYISNYQMADMVLKQFQISGIGEYVRQCQVKHIGPRLAVSAEITLFERLQCKL